jgi:hypothetical protein
MHLRLENEETYFTPDEYEQLEKVFELEWDLDDSDHEGRRIDLSGESSLAAGESDAEFSDRISKALWGELGYYFEITVNAYYLDAEPPCDTYLRDTVDYDRIMKIDTKFNDHKKRMLNVSKG